MYTAVLRAALPCTHAKTAVFRGALEPRTTLKSKVRIVANRERTEEVYVTLAAVDVGVLNITDFAKLDPFAGFFARRRYQVESRDLYGDIIEFNQYPIGAATVWRRKCAQPWR